MYQDKRNKQLDRAETLDEAEELESKASTIWVRAKAIQKIIIVNNVSKFKFLPVVVSYSCAKLYYIVVSGIWLMHV